ncbi:unnamed protein product [Closterium sp. Naga37s-1]|nr:unnamed protein product [Closterium sp. Naga37s-1]
MLYSYQFVVLSSSLNTQQLISSSSLSPDSCFALQPLLPHIQLRRNVQPMCAAKHPPALEDLPDRLPDFSPPEVPELTVPLLHQALRSAPRGTAAGPSGCLIEHLRDTFLSYQSHLPHFLRLFQNWLQGDLPQTVRPFFTASTLVALQKPQRGVRPIAIGEVLPRLLSRCVTLHFKQQIRDFFLPSLQFGVTVSAGIEVMAHAVQSALSLHPDWVVLEVDVANAFNSFSRSAMFNALRDSPFSSLIPFFRLFYPSPSPLHYRSGPLIETLQSSSGVRQALTARLNSLGLRVQPSKCSLWAPLDLPSDLTPPPDITASRILSLCVSARPSFLLRTVAPFPEIEELYTDWDNSLLDHFVRLIGSDYWPPTFDHTATAHRQTCLPIRLGGFGLRSSAAAATLSYLCSWAQTASLLSSCFTINGSHIFRPFITSDTMDRLDSCIPKALSKLHPSIRQHFPTWPALHAGYPQKLYSYLSQHLDAVMLERVRSTRPTLVLMNIILVGLQLSFAALLPAAWRYSRPPAGDSSSSGTGSGSTVEGGSSYSTGGCRLLNWWVLAAQLVGVGCSTGGCWLLNWWVLAAQLVGVGCSTGGCWLLNWWVLAAQLAAQLVGVGCSTGGCWLLNWWVLAAQLVGVGCSTGGCWLLNWWVLAAQLVGVGCSTGGCWLLNWCVLTAHAFTHVNHLCIPPCYPLMHAPMLPTHARIHVTHSCFDPFYPLMHLYFSPFLSSPSFPFLLFPTLPPFPPIFSQPSPSIPPSPFFLSLFCLPFFLFFLAAPTRTPLLAWEVGTVSAHSQARQLLAPAGSSHGAADAHNESGAHDAQEDASGSRRAHGKRHKKKRQGSKKNFKGRR